MSAQQHTANTDTSSGEDWTTGLAFGAVATIALPLIVAWKSAHLLAEHPTTWRRPRKWGNLTAAAGVVTSAALLTLLAPQLAAVAWPISWGTAAAVLTVWAAMLPASAAVAWWRVPWLATALAEGRANPRTADRIRQAIRRAAEAQARAAAARTGTGTLAVVLDDDRRDLITRWRDRRDRHRPPSAWLQGSRVVLPEQPPRAVVLGASGSGKTTALRDMVTDALSRGWRVAVLDLKGSHDDARAYLNGAQEAGHHCVWWTGSSSGNPYDGWRGDTGACVVKAAALLPQDGPQYYRQRAEHALRAVGSRKPWTSIPDLLSRLANPAAWVDDRADLAALTHKEQGRQVAAAVAADYAQALAGLAGTVDGGVNAWSWDDDSPEPWKLAIVSADAGADRAHLGAVALMLADLDAYRVARRSETAAPLLVIIDEAATVLDSEMAPDVGRLAEQVRSQQIGLIVAAQSVAGLGIQGPRLLESGSALIVGRMPNPDDVAQLAGTVRTPEMAHQATDGGQNLTGVTAAREQTAHRLDPDRVREAPVGCLAIVEGTQPVRWAQFRPAD